METLAMEKPVEKLVPAELSRKYVVMKPIGKMLAGHVVRGGDIAPVLRDDDAILNLERFKSLEALREANDFESTQTEVTILDTKKASSREESIQKLQREKFALERKVGDLEGQVFSLRALTMPQVETATTQQQASFAKLAGEKDKLSHDLRQQNANLTAALAAEQARVQDLQARLERIERVDPKGSQGKGR